MLLGFQRKLPAPLGSLGLQLLWLECPVQRLPQVGSWGLWRGISGGNSLSLYLGESKSEGLRLS